VFFAFESYSSDAIVRAVAFQFAVYREVLKSHGDNNYILPHSDIRKRQKAGENEFDFNVSKAVALSAAKWILGESKFYFVESTSNNTAMGGKSVQKMKLQKLQSYWESEVEKWTKICTDMT
jgi:hypothetical protein